MSNRIRAEIGDIITHQFLQITCVIDGILGNIMYVCMYDWIVRQIKIMIDYMSVYKNLFLYTSRDDLHFSSYISLFEVFICAYTKQSANCWID